MRVYDLGVRRGQILEGLGAVLKVIYFTLAKKATEELLKQGAIAFSDPT